MDNTHTFLTGLEMPYCPGCGHTVATNNISKALEKLSLHPLDAIVVSDIGCCGLVDPLLTCHTIHGLHGRAAVLGMGIAMGLHSDPKQTHKKIIAVQGDGGATIGLQHLLEAARQNINMTLLVENNMVFGMTGGQISGLSSNEFKAYRMPSEKEIPPFNICELAYRTGAAYTARVIAKGDISDTLAEAFAVKGFSLVEIITLCPSYAIRKIKDLNAPSHEEKKLTNEREEHKIQLHTAKNLFDSLEYISSQKHAEDRTQKDHIKIIIAGSAGEGVQSAADLLAMAGIAYGLHATKKGDYPITVGTGYSVSELILASDEINYTGISSPDVAIVTSMDGWENIKNKISDNTFIIADNSLNRTKNDKTTTQDFRTLSGRKGAVLTAIAYWLLQQKFIPLEMLLKAAQSHKHAESLTAAIQNADKLKKNF